MLRPLMLDRVGGEIHGADVVVVDERVLGGARLSLAPVLRRSTGLSLTAWRRRPGYDSSWRSSTARSPRARSVNCDNVSAVYLSTNPVQHQRTKHVEIDLHFVRDRVAIGDVRILHVPTTSQFANIFTKGLPSSTFSEFRSG